MGIDLTTVPDAPGEQDAKLERGRYRIFMNPDDEKPVLHTRVSNLPSLDDSTFLADWKLHMAFVGLQRRADYVALLQGTEEDDRKGFLGIAELAQEAAGANISRTLGSAIHGFTEKVDLGLWTIEDVPPLYRPHVAAYSEALKANRLRVVREHVEQTVVLASQRLAGTLDRALMDQNDRLLLADIKTGKQREGALGPQLGAYLMHEHTYDFETRTLGPPIALDQTEAVLIHLPATADEPYCDIKRVDAKLAIESFMLMLEVKDMRKVIKRKNVLVSPWEPPEPQPAAIVEPAPTPEPDATAVAVHKATHQIIDGFDGKAAVVPSSKFEEIKLRIGVIVDGGNRDLLKATWQHHGMEKFDIERTPEELEAMSRVVGFVEAELGIPFDKPFMPDPVDVQSFLDRIKALPDDLKIQSTIGKRPTSNELSAHETLIREAEITAGERHAQAVNAMSSLSAEASESIARQVCGEWPCPLTAQQLDAVMALADAVTSNVLDDQLNVTDDVEVAKGELLKAGRAAAKEQGLQSMPKNADDVKENPTLMALAMRGAA